MNKVCVILGAGASYDVANEGSPIENKAFRPPLATDLFNMEEHSDYWGILQNYYGATVLAPEIASRITFGAESVEEVLRFYAYHQDGVMRQHFKHIPPYLRHLIWATSRKYVHVPSCYVQLVIKLISNYQCKVLFLVLNYDDMLEGALKRAYPALFKFDDLTDYTRPERPAQVIKLHGSTNWFVQMPKLGSWEESVEKFDVLTKPEKEAITLNNGVTENFRRDFDEAYFLFPVITTPLAGKELTDVVCPDSHLEVAREFLSDCQKFLIIGTSGLDQDLMELLDSSINPACKNVVHSVNYGDGGLKSLLKFKEGVKAFNNRDSVHQVFDQGFRKYIAGTSLANLAAVDSFS